MKHNDLPPVYGPTDTMRASPLRKLSLGEIAAIDIIKTMGQDMHNALERLPGTSRELSTAKTRLEEAVMWAVKHITA